MFGNCKDEKMELTMAEQLSLDLGLAEASNANKHISNRTILTYHKGADGQPKNIQVLDPTKITPSEYSTFILKTFQTKDLDALLDEAILGLGGEAGEVLNEWRKEKYQGHPRNHKHMVEELGDVLCYLTVAAKALDVSLEYIMFQNVTKKLKRYPNGFNPNNSINR